jgi:hypothetical protein
MRRYESRLLLRRDVRAKLRLRRAFFWEAKMKLGATAIASAALSGLWCASAPAQSPFSQTDAVKLVSEQIITCYIIPIGTFKLGMETTQLTNYLKQFEASGFVTMTPVNTQTGNVFDDILNIGKNGLSATVNVNLAPSLDKSQLCSVNINNGQLTRPGIPFGPTTLSNVVSFQQIHGVGPDGIPFDGYVMQAVWNHQPTPLEMRYAPAVQRQRKSQALFRYDPFKQMWGIRTYQFKNLNEQFDANVFARELGRQTQ